MSGVRGMGGCYCQARGISSFEVTMLTIRYVSFADRQSVARKNGPSLALKIGNNFGKVMPRHDAYHRSEITSYSTSTDLTD
jgi:hypothetical protein